MLTVYIDNYLHNTWSFSPFYKSIKDDLTDKVHQTVLLSGDELTVDFKTFLLDNQISIEKNKENLTGVSHLTSISKIKKERTKSVFVMDPQVAIDPKNIVKLSQYFKVYYFTSPVFLQSPLINYLPIDTHYFVNSTISWKKIERIISRFSTNNVSKESVVDTTFKDYLSLSRKKEAKLLKYLENKTTWELTDLHNSSDVNPRRESHLPLYHDLKDDIDSRLAHIEDQLERILNTTNSDGFDNDPLNYFRKNMFGE